MNRSADKFLKNTIKCRDILHVSERKLEKFAYQQSRLVEVFVQNIANGGLNVA